MAGKLDKRSLGKICFKSGVMMRPAGLNELYNYVQANDPNEEEIDSLLAKLQNFDIVDSDQIKETLKTIEIEDLQGLTVINVLTNLTRYSLIADQFHAMS